MDFGFWILDFGLWTADCGLWTVDCKLPTFLSLSVENNLSFGSCLGITLVVEINF